ncbi:MAG: PD-(D/E)XK nuclease family protein [Actinomycetia bacterium]|nr:PD-(D/E)XK nuclease family protein [Actinomycetes bacterium]
MARYSHSKMNTFRQCPLKYRFGYIDHIKKEEEGIEAFTGSCVHEALEELLKLKKEFDREPDYEKAEELFLKTWEENYHPDIVIRRKNVTPEDYRRRGLMCLGNYFEMDKSQDFGELLGLEVRLNFPLGDSSIKGFIDRLQRDGNTFHIIDYKVTKNDMAQEKADSDTQLALYEMGIRKLYPDAQNVVLHWYMLPHNNVVDSTRSEGDLLDLESEVLALIEKIESTSDFLPVETALCGWCEYQEECEEEKRRRTVAASRVEPPVEELVEEYVQLNEEREKLNARVKEIEKKLEDMKPGFAAVVKETDAWSIESGDHVLDVDVGMGLYMPGKNTEERKLLEKLVRNAGMWGEMSEISKFLVLKALETDTFGDLGPDIRERFEERETVKIKIKDRPVPGE